MKRTVELLYVKTVEANSDDTAIQMVLNEVKERVKKDKLYTSPELEITVSTTTTFRKGVKK